MNVLSEEATLEAALSGRSIARVGEGEFRLAINQPCISQAVHHKLAQEMRTVLALPEAHPCLPCIPRIWKGMTRYDFWNKFMRPPFISLQRMRTYGSAFITRPDVAPNIDTAMYWERIRWLWRNKDVTLVIGTERSLNARTMPEAKTLRIVWSRRRDAYADIERVIEEVGKPSGPVIMCLGPTATILAMRLAAKGVHAIDLGHLGMFIGHEGVYNVGPEDFISVGYRAMQKEMHRHPEGYGASGQKYARDVIDWAKKNNADIVLDYGCGRGTLKTTMRQMGSNLIIHEYDPAVVGKDGPAKPADLVVCTDVLEHIEPDKLMAVLKHLYRLAKTAGYFCIATRLANKKLPDGRNAHILLHEAAWWIPLVLSSGWRIAKQEDKPGHSVKLWLIK